MDSTALLIVDVQYDFLPPNGSLAVPDGLDILPHIQGLLTTPWEWRRVVVSQDYHPQGHISFASSHPGKEPFSTIKVKDKEGNDIDQILWPDHCIQGTKGAEIEGSLLPLLECWKDRYHLVQKGTDKDLDAYSAFATPTTPSSTPSSPLADYFHKAGIKTLVICGIATDVCVRATALDAIDNGFEIYLVKEACKGVHGEKAEEAFKFLESKGAKLVRDETELRNLLQVRRG